MNKRFIFWFFIFFQIPLFSQENKGIITELLWFENNYVFYSTGNDTFSDIPGFISFDYSSGLISDNNYFLGYYVYSYLDEHVENIEDEILFQNEDLMINFIEGLKNSNGIKEYRFNKYWKYILCIVTFEKTYLGNFSHPIPIFSSENNPGLLKYKEEKIPIYFMKIISIKPYTYSENAQSIK